MDHNNTHIEGLVVDCNVGKTPFGQPYADLIVCAVKSINGDKESSFFQVRIPVSDKIKDNIDAIASDCIRNKELIDRTGTQLANHAIACDGRIRNDVTGQPYVLAKPEDMSFPLEISEKKNMIKAEGEVFKTVNTSPIAASLLIKIDNGPDRPATVLPVIIDAKTHPEVWSSAVNGEISKGDRLRFSGNPHGKIFGHGKDIMLRMSVKADSASVVMKQNLKTATRKKPVSKKSL